MARSSGRRLPAPFVRLEEEMEHLMTRFFRPEEGWWASGEGYSPAANLVETPEGYEVTFDLPGLKAKNINVELKNGELWITGERKEDREEKGKTYHRVERHYGEFRRVIPLPGAVDDEKIQAEYRDGVLSVLVPKSVEVLPKKIEVR